MPTSLAEYRIIGPTGPLSDRAWLAEPPARVGSSESVVVVELAGVDADAWPSVRARLTELAAVTSAHLPAILDSGRGEGEEPPAWLCRSRPLARSAAGLAGNRRGALAVLAGAARGAHDLHESGWAHGDIRVETILVDGTEGVLDLPIQALCNIAPAVSRPVQPAALDGYEPDRLWGMGPTRASDVYALGAAAHRLLTGGPVHPDLIRDQPVTAVQRVLVERPRVDPALGGPVGDLIRSCLDPDPARRPDSAAQLADRLDAMAAT